MRSVPVSPVFLFWAIALVWLVLDQVVKFIEVGSMRVGDSIALWPGVFHLTYVRNIGAAFSLFEGSFWLFYAAMILLLVLIGIFWKTEQPRTFLPVFAIALVFAGAVGNLIDRVRLGYVIDIFDLRIINFAVFNVADFGITIGCVAFFVWVLFFGGLDREESQPETPDTATDEDALR
jgi:signal peptidase II